MVLLFVTRQRTEMDRMVAMTAQAVAKTVGLADDSQVARGLSRVGQAMWPPAIAETEEVGRIQDLDRQKLRRCDNVGRRYWLGTGRRHHGFTRGD